MVVCGLSVVRLLQLCSGVIFFEFKFSCYKVYYIWLTKLDIEYQCMHLKQPHLHSICALETATPVHGAHLHSIHALETATPVHGAHLHSICALETATPVHSAHFHSIHALETATPVHSAHFHSMRALEITEKLLQKFIGNTMVLANLLRLYQDGRQCRLTLHSWERITWWYCEDACCVPA